MHYVWLNKYVGAHLLLFIALMIVWIARNQHSLTKIDFEYLISLW